MSSRCVAASCVLNPCRVVRAIEQRQRATQSPSPGDALHPHHPSDPSQSVPPETVCWVTPCHLAGDDGPLAAHVPSAPAERNAYSTLGVHLAPISPAVHAFLRLALT
jgi:hypothetical protein